MVFRELKRPDTEVGTDRRIPSGGVPDGGVPGGGVPEPGIPDATILLLHAHPDDETLATGALMARLVVEQVNVVLVTGPRGERGEGVPGCLTHLEAPPERAAVRGAELAAAMTQLGVIDHRFLGAGGARAAGLGA